MKKFIAFFGLCLILQSTALPQIDIGITGGLNLSWAKADEFLKPGYDYKLTTLNNLNPGFHFGLFSQIEVFNVLIQPEVLFTSLQNDIEYEDLRYNEIKQVRQEFNMLDIPVLVLLKYKIVKLEIGPVASILLEEKSFLYDEIGYRQKFNILSLGYQAGVGLDISKVCFDIRYAGYLTSSGDEIIIGDDKFSYNSGSQQVILSFGIFF